MQNNDLIFVIDRETFGVYSVVDSISVANSLATGLLDSFVRLIHPTDDWISKQIFDLSDITAIKENRFPQNVQLNFDRNTKLFSLALLPPHLENEKFLMFKQYARIRAHRLQSLESMFSDQMGRVSSYLLGIISPIIRSELAKVVGNPPTKFTPIIIEYATINGISPLAAYQELKLKSDSNDLIYMRNYSFFIKYNQAFNLVKTEKEAQQLWEDCINDLFLKATV